MMEKKQQEANLPSDKTWCEEVIISTVVRRGKGNVPHDPIRIITQVFTKEGKFIAEYDPIDINDPQTFKT